MSSAVYHIKKLAGEIGEYKKPAILTPIFVVLEVIMEILVPFLMAYLIDNGIDKGDMNTVIILGAVLITCTLLSLLFGILAGKFSADASAGFAKNLRHSVFYNIQNFSFSNIDKFSTSSLITRLTTDVTNVQNAFMMVIRIAIRAPVMMILAFVMVLIINGSLSIIFLCLLPLLALCMYLIITKAHPIFERIFKTYDKLNKVVQENIRGIRVVKSFVRESYEKKKFNAVSKEIYKDFSKAEKLLALISPTMQFFMYLAMLLVSWFGANLIVSDLFTKGELISVISYAMQILMSLMMLAMVFVMITMARASARRIVEVLDEETELTNPENPVTTVKDGSVSFKDVSFSYSKDSMRCALENINLEIKSGEMIGIIGGTGSSKTSLVQLIPRLYDVLSGSVSVGGVDVRDYDMKALRDEVSVVLQKNVLFSGTIKENLRWGNANATDEEIVRVSKLAHADEFIQTFPDKYDTKVEQGGTNVSGGQKQRLCIARALLKKPKILILDDSTSAVDTKTDADIRKSLREEIPNTTKIIIAQRISSIEGADKIIVLDGGKISALGTHEELLKASEIYREVYTSQTRGAE
ncbi:MAG: ABC transporter ATP-binding protein [Methanocorpusculum sp.]|nr:ABC transporter ATP-binding protein [Methanocorpusculum sp.]